jgi:hypothetical protein
MSSPINTKEEKLNDFFFIAKDYLRDIVLPTCLSIAREFGITQQEMKTLVEGFCVDFAETVVEKERRNA